MFEPAGCAGGGRLESSKWHLPLINGGQGIVYTYIYLHTYRCLLYPIIYLSTTWACISTSSSRCWCRRVAVSSFPYRLLHLLCVSKVCEQSRGDTVRFKLASHIKRVLVQDNSLQDNREGGGQRCSYVSAGLPYGCVIMGYVWLTKAECALSL